MQPAPTLPLIPTLYKTKIPHTHSWPIGAEAISKALAGAPQFEAFELAFSAGYQFQPQLTSYRVFDVSYYRRSVGFSSSREEIASGGMEPKWIIYVRPVPRGHRHAIQAQLLERGLPFTLKWLGENTTDERLGRSKLVFSYYEETQILGYEVEKNLEPERI